jgi:hypothetical protein
MNVVGGGAVTRDIVGHGLTFASSPSLGTSVST